MLELRWIAIQADADHVEPHQRLGPRPQGEKPVCKPREALTLARMNRLERGSAAITAPAADLDEDDRGAVGHHEIQLPAAAPPVARDDDVTPGFEIGHRQVLPSTADRATLVHAAGAIGHAAVAQYMQLR